MAFTPPAAGVDAIENVVEDLTPQLGGDLDVNGNSIVTTTDGDINLSPNGTGEVVLSDGTSLELQETIKFTSTVAGVNKIIVPDNIDGSAFAFVDDAGGGTLFRFKTANGFEEITFYSHTKFDNANVIIGGNVGFYNTAAQSKQTVTGSAASNAALQSLLTALSTLGLITDSST